MISRTPIEGFNKKFDVVSAFIDHKGETLLLHRQENKPQGNKWAMVAGKVDKGEDLVGALIREVDEEIGVKVTKEQCQYFEGYYVRYPDFDFMYHVYHIPLSEKPLLNINLEEHTDHQWIAPKKALKLDLIEDEDSCIKWFYGV